MLFGGWRPWARQTPCSHCLPVPRPPLLLVVGMHRSGTSLLGSLLRACGVSTPGPLIPGDVHNPEGYFERADVTALQEQLLIDLERWWPSPRGMEPLPEGWLESERGEKALADLLALLHPETERQQSPWAIKDPRSSLLLPLWKEACLRLNIPLQLLLAVRDPAEVMVSLMRRDQAVTGMDCWRAQRLWWHHNAQVLRDGADLPLQVVSYSHWFEPSTAHQQLDRLAQYGCSTEPKLTLQAIKPEYRRSQEHHLPTPLAKPVATFYWRLQQLALSNPVDQSVRRHYVEHWLNKQQALPPEPPLQRRRSGLKRALRQRLRLKRSEVSSHPWSLLAELQCGSPGPAAEHQLHFWQHHGFRRFELERFSCLPWACPPALHWQTTQSHTSVQVRGLEPEHWTVQAWLHHCPITSSSRSAVRLGDPEAAAVAINLSNLEPGLGCSQEVLQLASLEQVWDPDPQRVRLLRLFGVKAHWLQARRPISPPNEGWGANAERLGLPTPASLRSLGTSLCLGFGGADLNQQLQPPLLGIPGFDGLKLTSAADGLLLAQWLQGCLDAGLELVRAQPSSSEQMSQAWRALVQACSSNQAPILLLQEPICGEELLEELAWYRRGCPPPAACHTPTPSHRVLLDTRHGVANIAVCVSLYNYGSRILAALESVRQQRETSAIELIVVDDSSTDDGPAQVQAWIEKHQQHFARCLLLQHNSNGGLASARNSAFGAAESDWCFVLDADNQLAPLALAHCGALSREADPRCAVIHSLIQVAGETGSKDKRHLVSDLPWQRQTFLQGNYIDAMALVRREAWHAIGGYTHIPGGWEDYDFWCSLIDAGWHGVLCPQVLATYTSHNSSMRAHSTTRQERRLSRLLQQRHPWLDLPQTKDQPIWPHPSAPGAPAKPSENQA